MTQKQKVQYLKVISPFAVKMGKVKVKRVPINLNWYRNAHYLVSNKVKKLVAESISDQIEGIELETPVTVTYRVYKPTRRRLDKMNVVAITSKFVLDALSEAGVWEDDNDNFVKTETILPTIHDKDNERVEIVFETIKKDTI